MKRGKIRIFVGCILLFLQILSIIGNTKSGYNIQLSFDNLGIFFYDLFFLFGYFLIGLIGLILVISGLVAYCKKDKNQTNIIFDALTIAVGKGKKAIEKNCNEQPNYETDDDFGLVPEKPIFTRGFNEQEKYLQSLRGENGELLTWKRQGSMSVENVNGLVDIYDIYINDVFYKTLYINLYGAFLSSTTPKGFLFARDTADKSIQAVEEFNITQSKPKNKINKKTKIVCTILFAILLTSAILTPILYFSLKDNKPTIIKNKEYLYNWLVEEGNLVNNSSLEYTVIKEGVSYSLCYSTDYIDSLNMMLHYRYVTSEGYIINARLHLFTGDNAVFYISAESNNLNRWYEYSFKPSTYRENTPVSYVDNDGDTVDISEYTWFDGEKYRIDYNSMPADMKEKIQTIDILNELCEDYAKSVVNNILNWVKDEICPLANIGLSDLGYVKY